jgi:hypothetical protein
LRSFCGEEFRHFWDSRKRAREAPIDRKRLLGANAAEANGRLRYAVTSILILRDFLRTTDFVRWRGTLANTAEEQAHGEAFPSIDYGRRAERMGRLMDERRTNVTLALTTFTVPPGSRFPTGRKGGNIWLIPIMRHACDARGRWRAERHPHGMGYNGDDR